MKGMGGQEVRRELMADSHKDVFADRFPSPRVAKSPGTQEDAVASDRYAAAIRNSAQYLLSQQGRSGGWPGVVRASVRTTAEFVILLAAIERASAAARDESASVPSGTPGEKQPTAMVTEPPTACTGAGEKSAMRMAAADIASQQMPRGGWSSSAEVFDLDTSVLAYVALKLAGHDQQSEHMQRARDAILAFGGADACGPLIRYYLAFLGEIPYSSCLAIPPEFALLPAAVPSSWAAVHPFSRAVLAAVSVVWAERPVWLATSDPVDFDELWKRKNAKHKRPAKQAKTSAWQRLFHLLFRLSALIEASGCSLRPRALQAAEQWLQDHLDENDGVAGDANATLWAALAFLARGRSETDSCVEACLRFLGSLRPADDAPAALGIARTEVRDTALACRALGTAGCSLQDLGIQRAVDWLLCREARQPSASDETASLLAGWSVQGCGADFVDVETTALVLLALREQFTDSPPRVALAEDSMVAIVRASSPDFARQQVALLDRMAASSRRARQWLAAVQHADGGWGCRGKCPPLAERGRLPWCDTLLASDASLPSVTGVVLESISRWDRRRGCTTRAAIDYLRRTQTPDGTWCDGPGGRGAVFATWRAVCGLRAADVAAHDPAVQAAAAWFFRTQRDSGGWSGSALDCDKLAENTAQQGQVWRLGLELISVIHTAWALLALVAAGHGESSTVRRAVQFLREHQQPAGNWGRDDLAVGYRASTDCGKEPGGSVHYPLLAMTAWLCRAPASVLSAVD